MAEELSDEITVAVVQQSSTLDPAENREAVAAVSTDADLVVFPEAFARDFGKPGDDISAFAETGDGAFSRALEQLAREGQTVVAGMFEVSGDPERPYNTLLVRGATNVSYRKVHLYDSFGYKESDRLTAGPWRPTVVDVAGFRVGLLTCYDLRFPELARALVDDGAEVLVVPAAWVPGRTEAEHARKVDHWRTLVRARAIENTTYVVAAAQAAPRYTGHSLVVGPDGDTVSEADELPTLLTATLSRARITEARETNPSLANRRQGGG